MKQWTKWNWQLLIGLLFSALIAVSFTPVMADEDESGFTMDLGSVQMLTLQPDSLHFDASATDMVRGHTSQQVINASVSSNVEWLMQVSGSESYWSGPWDKPVEDLQWKYADGAFTALTTEAVDVSSGGATNQNTLPIHFKVLLDFSDDVPGEYQYEFVMIELTAP